MAAGDVKLVLPGSAAYTITLANMATDSSLLTGRESDAVSNATNKYLDYLIAGKVTAGTSPTASRQIEAWVYASFDDTPTYPDVFDGTDSAETVTSAAIKRAALACLGIIDTDNTSDRTYWFRPRALSSLFGGLIPVRHGIFVTHNTGVNLKNNAGDQAFWYTPVYANIAAS